MTRKQGLRLALFAAVLLGVLYAVIGVFGIPTDGTTLSIKKRFGEFYKEPENTWDCVLIGASCVDREWAAPLAWNDYGMTAYAMNSPLQPLMLATNLLDEVRKTQDVKLAVIDVRGIKMSALKPTEVKIRRVTDNMENSKNRWEAVTKSITYYKDFFAREDVEDVPEELDEAAMYFPFLKYHSRWKTGLDETDFLGIFSEMKGVYEDLAFKVKEVKPTEVIEDAEVLNDLQIGVLDEILEYGEENGLEILFISSPSHLDETEQMQINAGIQYLEQKGANVINFNTEEKYEELGLDFSEDLYDRHHLNSRGAAKFTKYFSKYLNDTYQFEDKRGEEAYQSWDEAYDKYVEFYENGWEISKL